MTGIMEAAVADGHLPVSAWMAAASHELGSGFGCNHLAGALPVASFAHGGDLMILGVVGLAALWTAVGAPARPLRLPLRQVLIALVGWAALFTPALFVVVVVGVLVRGPAVVGWATAGGLVAFFAASGIAATFGFRLLARRGLFDRAILVLGASPEWAELGVRLGSGRARLFRVAGVFPASERRALAARAVGCRKIWGIVVTDRIRGMGDDLEQRFRRAGVRLLNETEFRERWLERVDIDRLRPGAIAERRRALDRTDRLLGRRGADIVLSIMLLFLSLPVGLLAALLVKLDSPGPVFYSQERVGLHDKTFRLLKFRSMRQDAERGVGPRWADPTDSRVTRIGRFLRLARIDELPQLWNVLRGEMSLIGPRPERPYFVDQLKLTIPCYADRTTVKPGITGWAQVNYRYGASPEDARIKLAYDLYYVKYRSLLLDLRILLATVRVVLLQEGAR